jgi:ubiquinone/menaquinone biosynthesis C-methylase UbiE
MHRYESGLTAQDVYQWLFTDTKYSAKSRDGLGHGIGSESRCNGYRSLLDVGCGKAHFAKVVSEKYGIARVAVCDLAPAAVEYQRLLGMDAEQADLGAGLPYGDNEFECVTCFDVLEHIPPAETEKAVSELIRVASRRVLCSISHDLARAKGPHGEQLHLTVQPPEWWRALISSFNVYISVREITRFKIDARSIESALWEIVKRHDN